MREPQINSVNACQIKKNYIQRKLTTGTHQRNNTKKKSRGRKTEKNSIITLLFKSQQNFKNE